MRIDQVEITPLRLALKRPYIWAQGVEEAFTVNLIRMTLEDGTQGIGEVTTAPDAEGQKLVLEKITAGFKSRSVFEIAQLLAESYRARFLTFGGNMPRYFNQLASGLEMAALDAQGKLLGRPVWDLLGGALREEVGYFYFLQGESIAELAEDARCAVQQGHPVIYLKVGISAEHDLQAVAAVRAAIGGARLRLDANEAWSPHQALAMMERLRPFEIEYIEQPTPSGSLDSLAQVAARSPIAIGADQSVFTLQEVSRACALRAADMIAVGPREIGGLRAMIKAAGIAEGAGMSICIHSSMTTGITTCAEHHVARAIPNLDDGNQIMWQLLREDIVAAPDLTPKRGKLALPGAAGLGVTLDEDHIARASEAHRRFMEGSA